MELTLSIDESLVEKARAAAQARGTTLDDLLRTFVEQVAEEPDRKKLAQEYLEITRKHAGRSPEGWVFNREEIYDRGRSK